MQRLRTLQLRLNSVDPGAVREAGERVLAWREVAGHAKGAESRRRRLQSYVTDSIEALNSDFSRRLHGDFLPRLDQSFRSLFPEVENRATAMANMRALQLEDEYSGRLKTLERTFSSADGQLAELRAACEETYKKLAEFNYRLDQIWGDESLGDLTGWRTEMSKIRAEQDAAEKSPIEAFREGAFGDSDFEEPVTMRLTCPMCREKTGKRQPRTGLMEDFAGLFGIAPYRCSRCMLRFYRYPRGAKKPG
jgi:hypothetical protein